MGSRDDNWPTHWPSMFELLQLPSEDSETNKLLKSAAMREITWLINNGRSSRFSIGPWRSPRHELRGWLGSEREPRGAGAAVPRGSVRPPGWVSGSITATQTEQWTEKALSARAVKTARCWHCNLVQHPDIGPDLSAAAVR